MTETSITFTNERGEKLTGILQGSIDRCAVITCHGMFSNKNGAKQRMLADALLTCDIATLRFDFAGCGDSQGDMRNTTVSRRMADLDAAVNLIASCGAKRIGLFGSSIGGAVALLTAARDERIVAISTVAAVGDLASLIERQAENKKLREFFNPEILVDARAHDVLSAVTILHAPLFIIHGEDDDVVPCSDAHDIATSARNVTLEIIAGIGHRFDDQIILRPLIKRIKNFFVENL
ncbi:MAG: alpha/beta fold hydrolase [Deltaproteobacteria bacterium]|nr:alpha/beta fold hydrolase [Deltaproteobacteria bacterium]